MPCRICGVAAQSLLCAPCLSLLTTPAAEDLLVRRWPLCVARSRPRRARVAALGVVVAGAAVVALTTARSEPAPAPEPSRVVAAPPPTVETPTPRASKPPPQPPPLEADARLARVDRVVDRLSDIAARRAWGQDLREPMAELQELVDCFPGQVPLLSEQVQLLAGVREDLLLEPSAVEEAHHRAYRTIWLAAVGVEVDLASLETGDGWSAALARLVSSEGEDFDATLAAAAVGGYGDRFVERRAREAHTLAGLVSEEAGQLERARLHYAQATRLGDDLDLYAFWARARLRQLDALPAWWLRGRFARTHPSQLEAALTELCREEPSPRLLLWRAHHLVENTLAGATLGQLPKAGKEEWCVFVPYFRRDHLPFQLWVVVREGETGRLYQELSLQAKPRRSLAQIAELEPELEDLLERLELRVGSPCKDRPGSEGSVGILTLEYGPWLDRWLEWYFSAFSLTVERRGCRCCGSGVWFSGLASDLDPFNGVHYSGRKSVIAFTRPRDALFEAYAEVEFEAPAAGRAPDEGGR